MKTGITLFLLLMTASIFCQNKIYWTDRGDFTISRCNLDGSERELIHEPQVGQVEDIAFDSANGKMYWAEWVRIRRSDLDGGNLETLVTGLTRADGIDLDLENGKIYWTERGTNKIQRSNLDGSDVEDLLDSPVPESIALDIENNKMYWTDWQGDNEKIYRANFDGTDKEVLVDTDMLEKPYGLALDLMNGKMFWTDQEAGTINKSNLDGSNIEEIVSGLNQGVDVSLDLGGGKMYWIQGNSPKIARSNLDGSQIEELITTDLSFLTGIALFLGDNTATNEAKAVSVNIKPNPSNGNFTIEGGKVIKRVTVYSVDGKLVLEKDVNYFVSNIDMYRHPKGIYYLKIDFGNEIFKSEKIIIQ